MRTNYLKSLLQPHVGSYSKTEKIIAETLLSLGSKVSTMTLEQLSQTAGVSKTAIFEFVKKLGFSGYQSFKIKMAQQQAPKERSSELVVISNISHDDTPFVIAQKIINSSKVLLDELLNSLSDKQLENAVNLILSSRMLHFVGQGASSIIAYDSYHKFVRSTFECNYIQDHHIQLSYATKLSEKDCVFLFSHSGNTIETINIAEIARKNKAKIIVLTGNVMSPLVEYADVAFVVDSQEASLGSETLSSRNLYLTIMDILYSYIMYHDELHNKDSLKKIRKALQYSKVGE